MSNDIREGDLIKATHKKDPAGERVQQGRIQRITRDGYVEFTAGVGVHPLYYDFEVLERPIEKELLEGAREAYSNGKGPGHSLFNNGAAIQSVIEFVRAYDKEHAR